jgi:hypothetical protein
MQFWILSRKLLLPEPELGKSGFWFRLFPQDAHILASSGFSVPHLLQNGMKPPIFLPLCSLCQTLGDAGFGEIAMDKGYSLE